jgi:ribosome-associated toxin RatA of RatAB toxin-antitoxin module
MLVRRTALVERPAFHMFDLIEAAEQYPQFLPWCVGATIVSRDDDLVSADLRVRYAGVHFEVRTRNPKRRPEHMTIHLERGPFKRFEGEWTLRALSEDACKVDFTLDYEFASRMVTSVAGPVLDRMANAMVDAFVNRALVVPVVRPVVVMVVPEPVAPPAPIFVMPLESPPVAAEPGVVPLPNEPAPVVPVGAGPPSILAPVADAAATLSAPPEPRADSHDATDPRPPDPA